MKRAKQRREPPVISDDDWRQFCRAVARAGPQCQKVADDLRAFHIATLQVYASFLEAVWQHNPTLPERDIPMIKGGL